MVLKKTCWYSFMHPCRIGAMIGSGDAVDTTRFNRFGYYLGIAFQIQDDLLNLIGDVAKYGKEIAGDLMEGKRTLMLLHLFRHANGGDMERLTEFLGTPRLQRPDVDMHWVLERMHAYGSIDYAAAVARQVAGAALAEFDNAFGDRSDSDEKAFVFNLVNYMIRREL